MSLSLDDEGTEPTVKVVVACERWVSEALAEVIADAIAQICGVRATQVWGEVVMAPYAPDHADYG
jgi:hypothetical protein